MSDGLALPEGTPRGLPNCGVVACALVAGVSYDEAWQWFKRFGNHDGGPFRDNWKGRTYYKRYGDFLRYHNIWYIHISGLRQTARKVLAPLPREDRTYLVRVTGHAMVYRNGWLIDQMQTARLMQHHARHKHVTDIWAIAP